MTQPEFSHVVRIDRIGAEPTRLRLEAGAEERENLARRFALVAVDMLAAELELRRSGEDVTVEGRLQADVVQSCVATAEPVPAQVEEDFTLRFRPAPEPGRPDEEVELSDEELDTLFYEGAQIDLGEAVAETLALALDPYPRAPGADEILQAAGVKSEEEAGVFGALAGLRDKMRK